MHFSKVVVACASVAVVALAAVTQAIPARAQTDPISIKHCFVTEPKPLSKKAGGTQIDYINHGTKTAKSITFGVGYRNAESRYYRKVEDIGHFAPGDEISHHFALFNDITYAGKNTTSCSALKVVWSDGSTWIAR